MSERNRYDGKICDHETVGWVNAIVAGGKNSCRKVGEGGRQCGREYKIAFRTLRISSNERASPFNFACAAAT